MKKKKAWIMIIIILIVVIALLMFLPYGLNLLGLRAKYDGKSYDLAGKKALIITTSQATLAPSDTATGVYASEMTVPYYEFQNANITVDVASINGGKIPIEPQSLKYPIKTHADKQFLKDEEFQNKVNNSLSVKDVDFTKYDLIFLAGGWGASYDFAQSDILAQKITEANSKDIILGSVCHGALGLVSAKETDGQPLLKGKKATAVTNKQLVELKITGTPLHPQTELEKVGADYQSNTGFKDIFSTLTVVDGNIVTGQNQNSGQETANVMMSLFD